MIVELFPAAPGYSIKIFFLTYVVVAGVYGAMTASRKILWIQALPEAAAFGFILAS